MSLRALRRPSRRVISGSAVIMRLPMAAQVSPRGCAPRRMRSTLYCVEVTPQSRVLQWKARWRKSDVRIRFRSASSSMLEKGRSCTISSFRAAIGILPSTNLLLCDIEVDAKFDLVADHGGGKFGANSERGPADGGGGRKARASPPTDVAH